MSERCPGSFHWCSTTDGGSPQELVGRPSRYPKIQQDCIMLHHQLLSAPCRAQPLLFESLSFRRGNNRHAASPPPSFFFSHRTKKKKKHLNMVRRRGMYTSERLNHSKSKHERVRPRILRECLEFCAGGPMKQRPNTSSPSLLLILPSAPSSCLFKLTQT